LIRGSLFIISAPSGTGKTTILKKVMAAMPGLAFSVSHTTRTPRAGERDGVDYHFVDRESFLAMRDRGLFLEWAEVHGNLYGTSLEAIDANLAAGTDLILDIDVQGAHQIREKRNHQAVFLFIVPPSLEELEKRLSGRNTDATETIKLRLANARKELADVGRYDYVIVNDTVDEAVDVLRSIIIAERCKNRRSATGQPLSIPSPDDSAS